MPGEHCDLSLFLISHQELEDWQELLAHIRPAVEALNITFEILIADRQMDGITHEFAKQNECILIAPVTRDYGALVRAAFRQAAGDYIITMDTDQAPQFDFLRDVWSLRRNAEIIIGSRYVREGRAAMPALRRVLSRVLNFVFGRGLDLQVRDMSSAFRLYRTSIVKGLETQSKDYDILQEILVRARMEGYQIVEIPFHYQSSDPGYARAARFGWAYLQTFARLWKLRNSIASADYDARAYNALMPPQRYWQRQRYRIITDFIKGNNRERCLDVGCGSSRIIAELPQGSLALDILMRKLRYARRFGQPTVQGSIFNLPIPDEAFPCVLCSQVIEHVPRANVVEELDRVLQPGGFLILGTPDYANWEWRLIEWLYKVLLPQAYADEHVTHYTRAELVDEFIVRRRYRLEAMKYILRGELILALRKPD